MSLTGGSGDRVSDFWTFGHNHHGSLATHTLDLRIHDGSWTPVFDLQVRDYSRGCNQDHNGVSGTRVYDLQYHELAHPLAFRTYIWGCSGGSGTDVCDLYPHDQDHVAGSGTRVCEPHTHDLDHDVGFRAALVVKVLLPGLGLVGMIALAHNILGLGLKLLGWAGLA